MRLDVMGRARPRSPRYEALRGGAQHAQDIGERGEEVADEQHQERQAALQ
jgi:hypothetical protein